MRRALTRSVLLALSLVLAAALPAAAQDSEAPAFTLKPGDTLAVTVLEDENLSRQVLVRPDGKISMPIAGTIDAIGRTPEQVRSIIVARLGRDFITPPTVSVELVALGAENLLEQRELLQEETVGTVFVIGQVNAPGRFQFDTEEPIDILQALALAGGPGVFAATKRIQIRRRSDSGTQILLFDYEMVEDGEVAVDIVEMMDGDTIVVPERGLFE
ncbi:MAG: polysaccharide biosynthesis/export family protein [Pseudomonadota bacterium]